jgi:hypothetical protein
VTEPWKAAWNRTQATWLGSAVNLDDILVLLDRLGDPIYLQKQTSGADETLPIL